nr:aminotransferase class IV [Wolinella succinogenes]
MIQSFRLVRSEIDYSSKFTDRSALEVLLAQRGEADEVIILKGEEITDTSFSNLALWDGEVWLTPQNPLLAGTARARLIDEGVIKEARLGERELREARALALLNAMMGMKILEKFEIL